MCMIPLCGDWFFGGGAYFFQQAGMGTEDSFSFNMGLWTMACIGTVVSWFIIPVSDYAFLDEYLWADLS